MPLDDAAHELEELARTAGGVVADNIHCIIERPTANLYIGKGKAEEIAILCQEEEIDTVIFSRDLSGTQQRNLDEAIGRKTIDRTQLILDIFAKHASSPEGKMQVELAQLQYLLPRLIGKGLILSRQGGGIGTSGPGEQKLEVDRRGIRKKIDKLKSDLQAIARHRKLIHHKRRENRAPLVTLVGYTNAGKSTLLNSLTSATQLTQDSLFTTLDSISKSLVLANGEHIILADTVGFLQSLPHHLIEAFKATLEEVAESDLLVHVIDVSHPRVFEHAKAVNQVLQELKSADIPVLTALNKIDKITDPAMVHQIATKFPNPVAISAQLKQNLPALLGEIEKRFSDRMVEVELTLPHGRMDLVHEMYQKGKVNEVEYLQQGIRVKANLPKSSYQKFLSQSILK